MLTPSNTRAITPGEGRRFAIVASEYNSQYVDPMLESAKSCLERAGAGLVEVVRVPGAFEIPVVAAALAARREAAPAAVLCLGVILRGSTTHAQHIGEAVSQALVQIQIRELVPIIHEVLLLENEEQARQRCLDSGNNRGLEAATTALRMGATMARIR